MAAVQIEVSDEEACLSTAVVEDDAVANKARGDDGAEGRLATEVEGDRDPQDEAEEIEPVEAHKAGWTSIASNNDSIFVPRYSCLLLFDFVEGESARRGAGDLW